MDQEAEENFVLRKSLKIMKTWSTGFGTRPFPVFMNIIQKALGFEPTESVLRNMFVLIGKIDLKLRKKMVKDEFYNNLNLKIIKIYGKLIKNI